MLTEAVADSIEREIEICDRAIERIKQTLKALEKKHGMKSGDFVRKFESGKAGDEEELFIWHANCLALEDWSRTKKELEKFLHA